MKKISAKILRFLLLFAVLAVLALGGGALIQKKKRALAKAPRYQAPATLVETATVFRGELNEAHDYLAMVEPVESASVTARVTATIDSVMVDEGDPVRPGQTLLTLDQRQIETQQTAAQAQIKQAEADLQSNQATVAALEESYAYWTREADRAAQLAKSETIPVAQAEATIDKKSDAEGKLIAARGKSTSIEQQIRSLEARRAELEIMLSYCNIQSPFAGVVTSRLIDPGDQAAPGKTLLVIERDGELMIAFDAPQNDLPDIKAGLPVSFSAGGQSKQATISLLYPSLNRARMVRVQVLLDHEQAADLTSGQYLTATVVIKQHQDVPLIPVRALIEGGLQENTHVYVVEEGVLRARPIRVLGTACEQAAVEGLEAGQEVVVHSFLGWARLADGLSVEAR